MRLASRHCGILFQSVDFAPKTSRQMCAHLGVLATTWTIHPGSLCCETPIFNPMLFVDMMLRNIFRLLASLKLAVMLLVLLAGVLAVATFLEADRGREFSQWYVYSSGWFLALLGLLGANILSAALIRWPWKRHQTGFVITHAGLLVLLTGSILTFLFGLEGQVILREGEDAAEILVSGRSVIAAVRNTPRGQLSTEYSFCPGPSDWAEGQSLDFGKEHGLGLKVLKFYRHARESTRWIADEEDYDGAALQLTLTGPSGNLIREEWLTGNRYGGEAVIGPSKYEIWLVTVDTMLEDFLHPPDEEDSESGVLSLHYNGQMHRIRVDDYLGKRLLVGDSEIAVEIAEYLPNARPTPAGRFVSPSDAPINPLLELKIHEPGVDKPLRQIALAQKPLLNLDAVNGRPCPVKFWFHHAGVKPPPGAVFLQTPDGALFCRAISGNVVSEPQQVREGNSIPIGADFDVTIKRYLPRARQQNQYDSVDVAAGESSQMEAAAFIEIASGTKTHKTWLKRADPLLGSQLVQTAEGPVMVKFGYERRPLGFTLHLSDFERRRNPGSQGDASFSSTVKVVGEGSPADQTHEISMNEPLTHGSFTLYQSSFQDAGHGAETSILTAAYDPGRFLKYAGSLMICSGIFIMFFMRAYLFKSVPRIFADRADQPRAAASENDEAPLPLGLAPHLKRPRRCAPSNVTRSAG